MTSFSVSPNRGHRLSWLVSALAAINCFCASCSPDVSAEEVLGAKNLSIRTVHYHDFNGISTHGELFDFQELAVDTSGLPQFVQGPAFARAPDYSRYRSFYKSKLQVLACATWQKTPIDSSAEKVFHSVLQFGNLLDDEYSRRFLQKSYLTAPGNFYAYFAGYPVGNILYVLVPVEGRLFIVRKRG